MDNTLLVALQDAYKILKDKLDSIYEIFKEFYGENNVDLNIISSVEFANKLAEAELFHLVQEYRIVETHKKLYREYKYTPIKDIRDSTLISLVKESLRSLSNIYYNEYIVRPYILVYWPEVTVTNENNRSTVIQDLYAKILLDWNGKMYYAFGLNRATYTLSQFKYGYLHSHVSAIPKYDFTQFQNPCLGTGPINSTINSLSTTNNSDMWELFCLELDKYVHTESLAGVPYKYLERIGAIDKGFYSLKDLDIVTEHVIFEEEIRRVIRVFTLYFIKQNLLKFNYINGSYSLGMPNMDYIILLSNCFIFWYNKVYPESLLPKYSKTDLENKGIIQKVIITPKAIYYDLSANHTDYKEYIGEYMCTFKGRDIKINIIDDITIKDSLNYSYIVHPDISSAILNVILRTVNYKYGKSSSPQTTYFL